MVGWAWLMLGSSLGTYNPVILNQFWDLGHTNFGRGASKNGPTRPKMAKKTVWTIYWAKIWCDLYLKLVQNGWIDVPRPDPTIISTMLNQTFWPTRAVKPCILDHFWASLGQKRVGSNWLGWMSPKLDPTIPADQSSQTAFWPFCTTFGPFWAPLGQNRVLP